MANGLCEWIDDIRWLPAKNTGESVVPAFGLVRVVGVDSDGETLLVAWPDADGQDVLVNGITDIPAGGYGAVYAELLVDAAYEIADGIPVVGELWGVRANSPTLRAGQWGFAIVGAPVNSPTTGRVLAMRLGRGLDVRKNSTGSVFRQPRLNLVEGSGVTLTVADNPTSNEVDVTIAASGGGSGITVREQDGSPSYGSTTTLTFDEADGFVLSQPAGGEARVDLAAATTTQAGVMTTADQTFSGAKVFDGGMMTGLLGLGPRGSVGFGGSGGSAHDLGSAAIYMVLSPGSGLQITGFVATFPYQLMLLWNTDATDSITLKHQHTGSTAGNRIATPTAGDWTLGPKETAILSYSNVLPGSGQWDVLGRLGV